MLLFKTVFNGLELPHNKVVGICTYTDKLYLFIDNFYTRHIFAKVLSQISKGYINTIGTLRKHKVGNLNKSYVEKLYLLFLLRKRFLCYYTCT